MASLPLPELVQDFRLEAKVKGNRTTHYKASSRREAPEKEIWERGESLGRGGFGSVWLERNITGGQASRNIRAVKVLRPENTPLDIMRYSRELEALAKFSQEKYRGFFVQCYGWYNIQEVLCIAMEYCEHGDLKKYISQAGYLGEELSKELAWQILRGLDHMHTNNFAHRDLNPSNILIKSKPPKDFIVKICDLGLSKRIESDCTVSTIGGTPGFMPPEILGNHAKNANPFLADMWCFGATVYNMLTGQQASNDIIMYQQNNYTLKTDALIRKLANKEVVDFIQSLMASNPQERLTADKALLHLWIATGAGFSTSYSREDAALPGDNSEPDEPDDMSAITATKPSAQWTDFPLTEQILQSATEMVMLPSGVATDSRQKSRQIGHSALDYLGATKSHDPMRLGNAINDSPKAQNVTPSKSTENKEAITNSELKLQVSDSRHDTVRLLLTDTGNCVQTLKDHDGAVVSVAFSPDKRLMASGSYDKTVRLWSLDTWTCVRTLKGHRNSIRSVAFSIDSRLVASASYDKTVRLWSVDTGACVQILPGYNITVWSVAFSPDSGLVASASYDKMVRLCAVHTGTCIQTLEGHSNTVWSVAFSPNSRLVVSGSSDKTVRVWSTDTGTCVQTMRGHEDSVRSVAFSPDSRLVASASYDKTVRLWSTATWTCVQTLKGHTDLLYSVAVSPDSRLVASASYDKTVRLWSTDTGTCVQTLEGHSHTVWSVAFSPDSRLLASASSDETVRLWSVDTNIGIV